VRGTSTPSRLAGRSLGSHCSRQLLSIAASVMGAFLTHRGKRLSSSTTSTVCGGAFSDIMRGSRGVFFGISKREDGQAIEVQLFIKVSRIRAARRGRDEEGFVRFTDCLFEPLFVWRRSLKGPQHRGTRVRLKRQKWSTSS